jgi:tetratricopeptide (TPR) repeat protein
MAKFNYVIIWLNIDTLDLKQQLSTLLREQEKFEEAELLLRDVIKKREVIVGMDDNNLAGSLNALGLLLAKTNRIDEAVTLYKRALEIREKALGLDHPQTVLIRERLAKISIE